MIYAWTGSCTRGQQARSPEKQSSGENILISSKFRRLPLLIAQLDWPCCMLWWTDTGMPATARAINVSPICSLVRNLHGGNNTETLIHYGHCKAYTLVVDTLMKWYRTRKVWVDFWMEHLMHFCKAQGNHDSIKGLLISYYKLKQRFKPVEHAFRPPSYFRILPGL